MAELGWLCSQTRGEVQRFSFCHRSRALLAGEDGVVNSGWQKYGCELSVLFSSPCSSRSLAVAKGSLGSVIDLEMCWECGGQSLSHFRELVYCQLLLVPKP